MARVGIKQGTVGCMGDGYAHCAAALSDIFQRGHKNGRVQGKLREELEEAFEKWSEGDGDVEFITWCAEKINGGVTLERKYKDRGSRAEGVKIVSPDGRTDWTLAVWWIRGELDCGLDWTTEIVAKIERAEEAKAERRRRGEQRRRDGVFGGSRAAEVGRLLRRMREFMRNELNE